MADYNTNVQDMPFVSSAYKESIRDNFGVEVTNEISDPLPSYAYSVNPKRHFKKGDTIDKSKFFEYGSDHIKTHKANLNKINKALSQNKKAFDIFSDVNANTFGNPHTSIDNWQNALTNNKSKILAFDIESLGDIDGSFYTPTEITFKKTNLTDDGLKRVGNYSSYLVSPNQQSQEAINNLLDRVSDQLTDSKGNYIEDAPVPSLTSTERRTIADLIRYSKGSNIRSVSGKTELLSPSSNYGKYVSGSGDFIDWHKGRKLDPVELARQGLKRLNEKGMDASDVAKNLKRYTKEQMNNENVYFMGHNIESFDFRGLNEFLSQSNESFQINSSQYIDSYQMLKGIHPSYLSMKQMSGIDTQSMLTTSGGLYKMENLTKMMGYGNYSHTATNDVDQMIKVVNDLFFSSEGQDFINGNVMQNGGVFNKSTKSASMNTKSLQEGDLLFSVGGARGNDDALSFTTGFNKGEEVVQKSRFYVNTQHAYEFKGTYQQDGIYGAKLKNAMTGEFTYINKQSPEEVRNTIYRKFVNGNNFSDDEVMKMWRNAQDDLARTKFRQYTNNVSYGNYKGLKSMVEASMLEQEKGFRYMQEEGFKKVFSYTDKQDNFIRQNKLDEYYMQLRGRLQSDAPFLNKTIKSIENHPEYSEWTPQKKHRAVIEAYQKAQKEVGANTDTIDLVGPKKYGFNLKGPDGSDWFINLSSEKEASRSLRRIVNSAEEGVNSNKALGDNFFKEVLTRLEDHASALDEKQKEKFLHVLRNNVGKSSYFNGGGHYNINALSSLLVNHRDDIPGFSQVEQEVEGLSRTGKTKTKQMMANFDKYFKHGIDKTKNLQNDFAFYRGFSEKIENGLTQNIRALDETLQQNYKAHGIPLSQMETMEKQLDTYFGELGKRMRNNDEVDMGFSVFNTGNTQNAKITMAVYDDSVDGVGSSLDKLRKNNNAAVFDIPLINQDQYIQYGNTKKISPLAFVDKQGGKVKLKSSFDKVIGRLKSESTMDRMFRAAQQGDYAEIERIVHGQVSESIRNLSGSSKYISTNKVNLNPSNSYSDFSKKNYIDFTGLYKNTEINGETYESWEDIPFWEKEKMFKEGKINKDIKEALGDTNLSFASTRGHHALQGYMSTYDIRRNIPLGFYNKPGRENFIQQRNLRELSQEAIESIGDNIQRQKANGKVPNMTLNDLFIPESERFLRQADNGFNKPGVNMTVGNYNNQEIITELRKSADKLDYDFEEMFSTQAQYPSTWENQMIVSEEFAESLGHGKDNGIVASKNTYQKTFDTRLKPQLNKEVKRAIDNKGKKGYNPRTMEDIAQTIPGADNIRYERSSKHLITDYSLDEDGFLKSLTYQQEFEARPGVTKLTVGSEKMTIRNTVPEEVLRHAFGDVNAVMSADFKSHEVYGDVGTGIFKQAVLQANVNRENSRKAVQDVADIVNETFGLQTKVVSEEVNGEQRFTVLYDDGVKGYSKIAHSEEDIGKNIGENITKKLNKIDGINIDKNSFTLETRLAQNSEDINFMSVSGKYGKKGARFSPRYIRSLRDIGAEDTANWLKQKIVDDAGKAPKEMGEALRHLTGDKIDKYSTISLTNVNDFDELKSGSFEGLRGQKGKYYADEIDNTILDRKRPSWLELPEGVEINVGQADSQGRVGDKVKEIDKLYMTTPEITKTEDGTHVVDDLGKKQYSIFEKLKEYMNITQSKETLEDETPQEARERVIKSLESTVQDYYDTMLKEMSSSKGELYRQNMSTRLPASGRFSFQIMSPELEIAGQVQEKVKKGESVSEAVDNVASGLNIDNQTVRQARKNVRKSGVDAITEPNTVAVNKQRALDMLDGAPEQVKQIEETGETVGILGRSPLIHSHSTMPVKVQVDENLDYDTIRAPASIAQAVQGDSDGDKVSLAMAYDKKGYKAMRGDVGSVNRQLNSANIGGEDSYLKKAAQDFADIDDDGKVNAQYSSDTILDKDLLRWDKNSVPRYMEKLAESRMRNPLYTGTIDNTANYFRQVGRKHIDDNKKLMDFNKAIGNIIQESISGKHAMTSGESGIDPSRVTRALKQGNMDIFNEPGYRDILGDENQKEILKEVSDKARKEEGDESFNKLIDNMFYSQKVSDDMNIGAYIDQQSDATKTVNKELMDEIVWEEESKYASKKLKQATEDVKQYNNSSSYDMSKSTYDNMAKGVAEASAKATRTAQDVGKKFGMAGMIGMAVGGALVGQGMASDEPLPMDYINKPGMQPRDGDDNNQVMDSQKVENVIRQQGMQGMEIQVKGRTTIDKDPQELAGIVGNAVRNTSRRNVNLTVNTNDNRNDISQEWIEQKVVDALQ